MDYRSDFYKTNLIILTSILVNLVVTMILGATLTLSGLKMEGFYFYGLIVIVSLVSFFVPLIIWKLIFKGETALENFKKLTFQEIITLIIIGLTLLIPATIAGAPIAAVFSFLGFANTGVSPDIPDFMEILRLIIPISLVPGIFEELLMRGVALNRYSKHDKLLSIFITAFFFSLMHLNIVGFGIYFAIGLVLGYVVIRTGSVLAGIIIHVLYNFLALIASFLTGGAEYIDTTQIIESPEVTKFAFIGMFMVISIPIFAFSLYFITKITKNKQNISNKYYSNMLEADHDNRMNKAKFKYAFLNPPAIAVYAIFIIWHIIMLISPI